MDDLQRLRELMEENRIAQYGEWRTEDQIDEAERNLSVKFPDSFRWFQIHYDVHEIGQDDILYGVTWPGFDGNIVEQHQADVADGFTEPGRMLVSLGNEQYFYLATGEMSHGECPVYLVEFGQELHYADTFAQFLIRRIDELYTQSR